MAEPDEKGCLEQFFGLLIVASMLLMIVLSLLS
jgi:hypothetical protein